MNCGRTLRLGQKYKEQAETPKYQEGRAQSPAVAVEGVKSSQGASSRLQVSLSLVHSEAAGGRAEVHTRWNMEEGGGR